MTDPAPLSPFKLTPQRILILVLGVLALVMIIGAIGVLGSCVYLWFAMGDSPSVAAVLVGGTLLGVSSGLVMPAFIATTLLGVPSDQHSVGSSINFMAQRTGATLGTALAITFVAESVGSEGLHDALLVGAIGTAACLGLAFVVGRPAPTGTAPLVGEAAVSS